MSAKTAVLLIIFSALICVAIFILSGCFSGGNAETFEATFLNTGKSDCILIETDGIVILNDTADEDDFSAIKSVLDSKNIEKIDYLILSHFDKDHIGSAADIIKSCDIGCVVMPVYDETSDVYKKMMKQLNKKGIEKKLLRETLEISTKNGSVAVYAPKSDSYENENNFSLITEVNYKTSSMLLMGDALKLRTSEFIMEQGNDIKKYDLIKIPHHGEYNKMLDELIGKGSPEYAVITDDSSHSHTEKKLLNLLDENNCRAIFTSDGNVTVRYSDGSFKC